MATACLITRGQLPLHGWPASMPLAYLSVIVIIIIIIIIIIILFHCHRLRHHHRPSPVPAELLYLSFYDLFYFLHFEIIFSFSSSKRAVEVPM
jgi:hypothetical protein